METFSVFWLSLYAVFPFLMAVILRTLASTLYSIVLSIFHVLSVLLKPAFIIVILFLAYAIADELARSGYSPELKWALSTIITGIFLLIILWLLYGYIIEYTLDIALMFCDIVISGLTTKADSFDNKFKKTIIRIQDKLVHN